VFTGIGWYIVTAILIGTFAGVWLDRRLGTSPLLLLGGLFAGLVVAFYGTYRMMAPFIAGQRDNKR